MGIFPDQFLLKGTEIIVINAVSWSSVDTFVDSGPTDKVYKIVPLSDNQFQAEFGDGTLGEIPGNFEIFSNYLHCPK